MSKVQSRYFGLLEYTERDLFVFREGLPGFPLERSFLPVEIPDQFPLVYLQSLLNPNLCFIALPAPCLVSDYRPRVNPEDLAAIGITPDSVPGPGSLVLALICFTADGSAAANLRAPLLINTQSRCGVQAIQTDETYPVRFSLSSQRPESQACS
jgi:flagellar assembly factor FliW